MSVDTPLVGKAFAERYYNSLDSDRPSLTASYRDNSMLIFEADMFEGAAAIMAKLLSIPAGNHDLAGIDSLPGPNGDICILVKGSYVINQQPLGFHEFFQIMPEGEQGYWILNQIFKFDFET